MRCSEPLRASRHLLPPPPFHPPCRCRFQRCWRYCLSASENDCESNETRECVIPRRIRRLSHHSKPDVCGPPAPAGRMVRLLVRTVGNRWASRILSIHWQVSDRAGRTSHVAEVWHGLLGLQGTSPQVAVRPNPYEGCQRVS